MMAAGSVDGIFRNIFEGCISSCDASIERRPYHKNCSCALHKRSCRHKRSEVVWFPITRSWSEGNSMALHLTSSSSSSNLHSLSSSSSISTLASLSSTASLTMSDIDSSIEGLKY
ncbi:hypothetical protein F2Q70_00039005 [Brassica cretica]|uniref:BnaC08g47150D protein n=6 Tax=Brassica TaxID=3705 RepID=A0A078J690_BRANA|nr:PREDICTED: uncharacterized protein LOC106310986 [Brassica oleracea var. oleracea]XP_013673060.1 uncharacterized protein LOC106377381 [Brassica napus]KAF2590013.1 hypothetical protein F2Q70_00039005 [Brassica cretica]KAG2255850.1 hypothetical protein Bca52824_075144 [Brassica carinata]KAG5388946.1 hypothetical protein IGI04_030487 [Brassica rapa subsp. trilocularis]VDD54818.1 unnamed protein product [Brassica oleracea]KAF3496586.1 hypothetical protein DY000_02053402 [Brassica cretica]